MGPGSSTISPAVSSNLDRSEMMAIYQNHHQLPSSVAYWHRSTSSDWYPLIYPIDMLDVNQILLLICTKTTLVEAKIKPRVNLIQLLTVYRCTLEVGSFDKKRLGWRFRNTEPNAGSATILITRVGNTLSHGSKEQPR